MKVIAASVVTPGDHGVICYMTPQEANLVQSMMGYVVGSGPKRDLSLIIYHALNGKAGVVSNPFEAAPKFKAN